ncbi:MAG: DinB superfamily protein, partial [Chitinophagales bacterium]|nr:DinB superfamily protein [Chitinophagales bacterium]
MLAESFIKFYGDAIDAAVNELKQYSTEDNIWKVPPGINNSAGNLALHLAGNLNYFFGTLLGQTGYVRDRDK